MIMTSLVMPKKAFESRVDFTLVHHRFLNVLNSLDFNEISKWTFGQFCSVDSEDSWKFSLSGNCCISPTTSAIDIPKVFLLTFRDLTGLAVASTRRYDLGSRQIK